MKDLLELPAETSPKSLLIESLSCKGKLLDL